MYATTMYNFVRLKATHKISPLEELVTRLRYIHTINLPINLNTDLLLFGSTDLTNTLNTDIFLNVQQVVKFILIRIPVVIWCSRFN
jgi:hypothetical protein